MPAPKFPAVATMLVDKRGQAQDERGRDLPDDAAVLRPAGAVLIEVHDEMAGHRAPLAVGGLDGKLTRTNDDDRRPKAVRRATAELVST